MLLLLTGCALSLSELRSARVLDRGEHQVTHGNDVVVPIAGVRQTVRAGKQLAAALDEDSTLSADEQETLLAGAAAVALTSPGYGTWLQYSRGLGHDLDASFRLGSGIYALGFRRGLHRDPWFASVGLRAAYNTGGAWSGLLDAMNTFVKISDLKRADLSLTAQGGVELGEWGRAWCGVKGMRSPYRLRIDASAIDRGTDEAAGTLRYSGGFIGAGIGYRWIHAVGELTVVYARGSVSLFDQDSDLSGLILAPSWGIQGTF